MAYSEKVVDHYENPRNVGTLDKSSTEVGTGLVGAPECGDVMRLQIKVNPETQVIEDAKFKTFGCGSAIASSSLATEWVKGKTVSEALTISNTDIVKELALPRSRSTARCSRKTRSARRLATGRRRTTLAKKPALLLRLTKAQSTLKQAAHKLRRLLLVLISGPGHDVNSTTDERFGEHICLIRPAFGLGRSTQY